MQRADGEAVWSTGSRTRAGRVTTIYPSNDGVQKPRGPEGSKRVAKLRESATGVCIISSVEDGQGHVDKGN